MRIQSVLAGAALSRHVAVGGGAFPRCAKPPMLDSQCGVAHPDSRWTGPFVEKNAFNRGRSSNIRVIMVIMHVLVVERLWPSVMGRILALECLLPWARGCLRSCHIMLGI
jgi:hypothetical protein